MADRSRKRARRRGRRGGAPDQALEWIGGRLAPPFFIEDREEPYRLELAVWMELPSGLVVGQEAVAPEQVPGAVGRALRAGLERPLSGPARQPTRIRVANAALADEVREVVGDAIPVTVAPTPELDALLELMIETMPEQEEESSYFEGGRVPEDAVARLFQAARVLYAVKPWRTVFDSQVLRMDIPALGVEGACVSIIGNLGESLGVLVFPSFAGYAAFAQAAEAGPPARGPLDLGTDWLALSFERGADLPVSLRREVADHGWPVADANAYPRVDRRDRDGAPRPLVARDVEIATACAFSLAAFFAKHSGLFESDDPEPVCESWLDENDLEVRFTLPYQAFPFFDVGSGAVRTGARAATSSSTHTGPRVGRNAPCPCGSGRKYKKCCLRRDEEERAAQAARESEHDLDSQLVKALAAFASRRFGTSWWSFEEDFADADEAVQLSVPWSVFHHQVEGATACEHFLAEHGSSLAPHERRWLAAQQAAWLSVWEVTAVEPGVSLTIRDLLSAETRHVREVRASQTLVVRDAFLGRVVDHEGESLLCGAHPRVLPPKIAADLVRRARGRLRRKRAVPVERLRDHAFGRYLIGRWEHAVDELDLERELLREFPPELHNTDGDPFLLTTDHFEIAGGEVAAVEASLAAMPGTEPPDPEDDEPAYVFMREGNAMHASWENTVVGRACIEGTALRLETNSRERADALREAVEAACGERVRYRAREHMDPLSEQAPAPRPRPPAEAPSPEMEEALLEFKRRHYADWADQPLPALDGKTPREVARTAAGRGAVDVLLKDMENHEQRAGGPAFDFSEIRRALRLK